MRFLLIAVVLALFAGFLYDRFISGDTDVSQIIGAVQERAENIRSDSETPSKIYDEAAKIFASLKGEAANTAASYLMNDITCDKALLIYQNFMQENNTKEKKDKDNDNPVLTAFNNMKKSGVSNEDIERYIKETFCK